MTPTIDEISTAFIAGYPQLTDEEQRLAHAVYRLLATGRPAPVDAIATAVGWARDATAVRLDTWPAVFRDGDGGVVRFWGLAAEPVTSHRMDFEGCGTAWTWCSYDTLFIAHLLGVTARVSSVGATTRDPVGLTVSPHGVTDVEPAQAVVSLLAPDRPFDDDVRQSFCHFVLFFASPGSAEKWTHDNPGTFWMPVADAFEVAERTNATVFPALGGGINEAGSGRR
jgi:alkylmercury lyase